MVKYINLTSNFCKEGLVLSNEIRIMKKKLYKKNYMNDIILLYDFNVFNILVIFYLDLIK